MSNLPPAPPGQAITARDRSARESHSRRGSRPTVLDVALVIAVAVALGVTVALLLTDVLAGIAVAFGTAVVFRFVLRAINS
jgi:hypothetical protein